MRVSDDTILGKKLARASSSTIAVFSCLITSTAASLMLFHWLSARLSKVMRIASPNAGILLVAVRASLAGCEREASLSNSLMHLKDSACSSSEVAVMPFSADDGLAKKVHRINSCPDSAGSRPPPQPERRRTNTHSRQSSRARTGTCRERRSTCETGTKAYSASLESRVPGRETMEVRVLNKLVRASIKRRFPLGS